MAKFLSGRQRNLNLGITSFTESKTVLQTTGKVGIGTTDAQQSALYVVGSVNIDDNINVSGVSTFVGVSTFQNDLYVGGNFEVAGTSEFIGVVTFRGGTINIGDSDTDDVVVGGEFASNLVPTTDGQYDLGTSGKQWRDVYVNGTIDTDQLNVSGVSTFTGAIDANGDLDVDGHTELDNLNVSGVSTFAGAADFNGDVDIDGRTELDVTNISETLNVVGISTFESDIDINASIDVEGHTELNTLNVVGVSTFTSDSTVIQVISGKVGIGTTVSKTPIQIDSYGISTGIGTFIASSGITTDIDSFVISESDFKMLEYTIHVQNGSRFQAQKVLLMQDNSTAYSQEYAIMYEPDLIVSVGSTISSGVCKLQVTPETGISGLTTYRFSRGSIF